MKTGYAMLGDEQVECTEAERALDSLQPLVASIADATREIERFVNRFHGAPTQLRGESKPLPPSGHIGTIKALEEAVVALQKQSSALDAIG